MYAHHPVRRTTAIQAIYPRRMQTSESDDDDESSSHLNPYPASTPLDSPREFPTGSTRCSEQMRKNVSFDIAEVPTYAMSSHRQPVSWASSSTSSKHSIPYPNTNSSRRSYQVQQGTIEEAVVIRPTIPTLHLASTRRQQLSPPTSPNHSAVLKCKSVPTSVRTSSSTTRTTMSSPTVTFSPTLTTNRVQCPKCLSYAHSVLLGFWEEKNTPVYYCGNETPVGSGDQPHTLSNTNGDVVLCGYVWATNAGEIKQIYAIIMVYDQMSHRMIVRFKDTH